MASSTYKGTPGTPGESRRTSISSFGGRARYTLRGELPQSTFDSRTKRKVLAAVQDIMVGQREATRGPLLMERLIAEFVGTFFLVLTVTIAAVSSNVRMAATAIGVMLGVQIYTFGAVSGGFFNPAVVLAVLCSGRDKITLLDGFLYTIVEIVGGIIGAFSGFLATRKTFSFDYDLLEREWFVSFEVETLFTMALASIVLSAGTSNDAPNQYFGFAIGLSVTAAAFALDGFDQASFNPAVTIGVNLANYANSSAAHLPSFGAWVVFLIAPLFGGAAAAVVFRLTRSNEYRDISLREELQQVERIGKVLDTFRSGGGGGGGRE